jgi:hypothetical protein
VAVASNGTNRVMTSLDSITWSAYAASEANVWNSVAWSPRLKLFVSVALSGTNRVMDIVPEYVKAYKFTGNDKRVLIRASDTLSDNYTLTLPTAPGSVDQILKTDASGNLSWVDQPSTDISGSSNDTELLFNSSDTITGSSSLTWSGTSLGLTGTLAVTGSTSGTLTIAVPATVTDYTLTLPAAVGSADQVLKTDAWEICHG